MPNPSLSVRIGSTGKAELRNDFAEIKKDGVDTQEQIASAGEAAAKRVVNAYERANADLLAADRRRAAAADKVAAMAPQTNLQFAAQTAAMPAGGLGEKSARDSAAAMRDLLRQEELLEAKTHALKLAYDPLYAAQTRFNQATQRANELLAAGRIPAELHAKVLAQEEIALRRAKEATEGHTTSMGLNRMQMITAQSAVMRFTDSVIAGASPLKAFALEAHKGAEVLSMDDGGMAGGIAKVRALINPLTVGIGAAVAVAAAGTAAWYSYSRSMGELEAVSRGAGAQMGLTGQQLELSAVAASHAGSMTIRAAEDIEKGYLQVARSGAVLTGLTAVTKDFAAATGEDMKSAQQELVTAFSDVIDGADKLAQKYGVLTGAQQDEIAKLVEEGKTDEAQRKLVEALTDAYHGAARQAGGFSVALDRIAEAASNTYHWLGKMIDQQARLGTYGPFVQMLTGPEGATGPKLSPAQSRANALAALADSSFQSYAGDNTAEITKRVGLLKSAINSGGTLVQLHQWTEELHANQRALETWIPKQQKARELAEADVKVAHAKTKAEKDAAVAERERIRLKGEVITAADAEAMANAKGAAAAEHVRGHHARNTDALRRQAEAMVIDTRETLKLADAWLEGSDKAMVAEARRKALTDATRKGIDLEAQARRQLALDIAKEVAAGGERVSHMRNETAIRREVNDRVSAGTLAVADMNRVMADEAVIRPLLMLRAHAHGDVLKALTRDIKAQTAAFEERNDALAKSEALAGTDAATRQTEDILKLIPFAGDPQRRAIEAARIAAEREADDHKFVDTPDDPQRTNFLRSRAALAGAQAADNRAQFAAQTLQSQKDSLALSERELQLVGANDNYRQAELDKLRMIFELTKAKIPLDSEDGKRLLANVATIDVMVAHTRKLQAEMAEAKQFGDQFIDDVLNPDNWKNFGDFGLKVLKDIELELLKLAAINPLKNWLLGENNPTAGGVFSALGSLFGGGGDLSWLSEGFGGFGASAFASGTDYAPGGRALVGEEGPEIVNLPAGSQVIPAGQTRRMLASNDTGAEHKIVISVTNHIDATGADPAQLQRVVRRLDEMPGTIVQTVADARQRRLL